MSLSTVPPLSELDHPRFLRLLEWSSREPDFAFLGSLGAGMERGRYTVFSALATASHDIPAGDDGSSTGRAHRLESDMAATMAPYADSSWPENVPFPGGWVGVISYEYGYLTEKRLAPLAPAMPYPLFSARLYLWCAWQDRKEGSFHLWIHPGCPADQRAQIEHWLGNPPASNDRHWQLTDPFQPRQPHEAFLASVRNIRDYIEAGDCYQANLSQEFEGRYQGEPWRAFTELTAANPTPYAAFLRTGEWSVLSVSPERFLEIREGVVRTSPIKGTRPRGATPEADQQLAAELCNSEKDRAENLMIVDLLRNDLSHYARPGSVVVEELFALESYRNVHHLVSHIRAELNDGISPMAALLSAFPGGSITGAPKVRAMEIIRELEPHWRGPYCGSVFYWGLDGRLDSSIAIRTLLCNSRDRSIRCWGGGGIVADSDPEGEYQETLTKVRPLMAFLESLR